MHDSSSGLDTYGRYASAGPLPCTESNNVWYFKLLVNICFSSGLNVW